ncbi:MAG: hypothetical protein OIF58_13540 [Cohaesibacter sp.]|nr:hypothetical protein [Cohaesibacter sp.]
MASAENLTAAEYMRRTLTTRRPRPIPERKAALSDLLFALQKIATNCRQLEAATGQNTYGKWARYVGKDTVERALERPDALPQIIDSLPDINIAGQSVNALAHTANSGEPLNYDLVSMAFDQLKAALSPLHEALKDPAPEE